MGNAYYRPIVPLFFSFISGIICGHFVTGWSLLIISLTGISFSMIIYRLLSDKPCKWSPLILFACLGYLAFASIHAASLRANHVSHFRDARMWNITGTVAFEPVLQTRRQNLILENLELSPITKQEPPSEVLGNVQVNIYGSGKELAAGNRIKVSGQIKPIRSFHNPGGFDYTRYMMWKNIWGTVSVPADRVEIMPSVGASIFRTGLNTFRRNILELIYQAANGDASAILSALILGDRRNLSAPLQEAFNRVGVSHVLSISGLHVGIVATAAFVFFKWLLSFFKPLLLRAWTKKVAAVCAIFPVIFYGLLAGMEPATQRSVIMVSVFLMTFLIQREPDLFNTIAIAALVILIMDPPALFSISFQLSFAAVLSISWGMTGLTEKISQSIISRYAVLKYAVTLLSVSLCAIMGVAPLGMHYFNTFPLSGILANLVVVPLMGSVVVVMGLFSVLVMYPFSSHAALWGLKICSWILDPVIGFIYYLSGISFAAIKTITPSILEIICFYLLVWGFIELYRNKWVAKERAPIENKNRIQPRPTSQWSKRWIGVMVAVSVLVLFIDILYWANQRLWNNDLRITLMDVGQGNAAVLEMPKGSCMVIDGGGFGDNSAFDPGERIVAPFLWRHKIRTVDTVVLTHADADHLNGLIYILKHFHVKQVISTHHASDNPVYKDFMDLIRKNDISHPKFAQIHRTSTINDTTVEILHPDADFMEHSPSSSPKDINNNSIVVKVSFGGFSILFPGDIMLAAEKDMVMKMPQSLTADMLVAPHHGSKTSSSTAFLDAVDPKAIVVSSGKEGHFPSKSVVERYEKREVPIFRTDHNGAVLVIMDGETMTVEPMLGDKLKKGFTYLNDSRL